MKKNKNSNTNSKTKNGKSTNKNVEQMLIQDGEKLGLITLDIVFKDSGRDMTRLSTTDLKPIYDMFSTDIYTFYLVGTNGKRNKNPLPDSLSELEQ